MNNNYLRFLNYFNPLPKISIHLNCYCHKDNLKNIIYPKNKLNFNNNLDNSEYIEDKHIAEAVQYRNNFNLQEKI